MDSEEEQLEALQKWWKENGRAVVVGVVLGLGGVFGWQSWVAHVDRRGEAASIEYQKLADTALREDHAGAVAQAEVLVAEFPKTAYAALASLIAARSAFESDQVDEARRHLQWVIDNATRTGLRDVARLRLARIELDAAELDRAAAHLGAIEAPGLESLVEEVRGDLSMARGDADSARTAYTAALDARGNTPSGRTRVQMKLDDLGPAASSS